MTIVPYTHDKQHEWNQFVKESKNGTFLFDRNFMDYHSDRFEDCSLLVEHNGRTIACMPANINRKTRQVVSHGGLTYGGLIMSRQISMTQVLETFNLILKYYSKELGAESFVYKAIPYIYSTYPAEEVLYALYRCGAELMSRGVSSTIHLPHHIPLNQNRKRKVKTASGNNLQISDSSDTDCFWELLNNTLTTNHNVSPVHTAAELKLLVSRFPEQIRLYTTIDQSNNILAGTLVFDMGHTVHTQYLAASEEGKRLGALDLLLHNLITETYADRQYFDFGISTEQGGRILNEGLIYQKEGFGGRAVCYDTYIVKNLSVFGQHK